MGFGESDLQWLKTNKHARGAHLNNKTTDICFVSLEATQWHEDIKNWTLGMTVFEKLANETNYTMLLIGRELPEHL